VTVASGIVIHNPNISRAGIIGFGTFWCLGVLAFVVGLAIHGTPVVIVPVVLLVFGLALMYRMWRLGIVSHGDTLIVRNLLRTHGLTRAEIEGFRRRSEQFERVGYAHLRDGTELRLDVTRQPHIFQRDPNTLDEQLDQLREWLAENE
jgi:hypothetical protein